MLTIEILKQAGANTAKGMERCMNNEAFYLRLVNMALDDANFGKLEQAVRGGDVKAGFEAAHALKGVLGNLELSQIYEPVSALTELLRSGEPADGTAYLEEILKKRDELLALRG